MSTSDDLIEVEGDVRGEKPFIPSPWLLGQMIAGAEAKFDASRDQAERAADERENERIARAWNSEAKAKRLGLLFGPTA